MGAASQLLASQNAAAGGGSGNGLWDSAANSGMTLSNSDQDAAETGTAYVGVRGKPSFATGKKSIEFECILGGAGTEDDMCVGFCNSAADLTAASRLGSGNFKILWMGELGIIQASGVTQSHTGDIWVQGDILSIVVDIDTRKFWCRLNGGAWIGGGDPDADTTPTGTYSTDEAITPFYASFDFPATEHKMRIRGTAAAHAFTIPTTAIAWGG